MTEPGAAELPLDPEARAELAPVLARFGYRLSQAHSRFVDPRFDKRYDVFRIETPDGPVIVKKDEGDHEPYERFLDAHPELPVPRRLATAEVDGVRWHVFSYAGGEDLQVLDRPQAEAAADALARLHAAFWSEGEPPADLTERLAQRSWRFDLTRATHPELGPALDALQRRSAIAPHPFCHGDLLPMNVLWDGTAATLIDFGAGGRRPYFSDPARFVVFSGPDAHFVQPAVCREAFLDAYLRRVRELTGTALTDAEFARDIALGELYEFVCVVSGTLRREQRGQATPDERGASYEADLDALRRVASRVA